MDKKTQYKDRLLTQQLGIFFLLFSRPSQINTKLLQRMEKDIKKELLWKYKNNRLQDKVLLDSEGHFIKLKGSAYEFSYNS